MYVTTNSALVWKRVADESQQSARMLARVSIGLMLLMVLVGAYAYSEHKRSSDMCATIRAEALTAPTAAVQKFGNEVLSSHCN